jgi:ribosomal-protein-alanine N-acetyltransferase
MLSPKTRYTLAHLRDADGIAAMSRDLIETDLGWSWRAERVARAVRDIDCVVLKAVQGGQAVGFAIMGFGAEEAHLELLAVTPSVQRRGIGRGLVEWLERSALTAGVGIVRLEVRALRRGERRFYQRLGYRSVAITPGYYAGREAAVRMAKDLWAEIGTTLEG